MRKFQILSLALLIGCSGSGTNGGDGGDDDGSNGSNGGGTVCAMPEQPRSPTCPAGKAFLGATKTSPYLDEGDINGVAGGDLDGDGFTDIVLSHTDRYFEVLMNKGDGTFKPGAKIEENNGAGGIAVADFSGDCKPDVLITSFAGDSVDDHVQLHAGNGDGTFGKTTKIDLKYDNVTQIIPADLDGNKSIDFIFEATLAVSSNYPNVVMNNGGTFTGQGDDIDGAGLVFNVGNVGGDSTPDVVSATENDGMCVRLNNGHGKFGAPACVPLSANLAPSFIEVADLNGDGLGDVVVGGDDSSGNDDRTFNVFLAKTGGGFSDHVPYGFPAGLDALKIADVDLDGKPDIVAFGDNGSASIYVLKNIGNGKFDDAAPEHTSVTGPLQRTPEAMVIGDFLGNGLAGVAVLDRYNSVVSVLPGDCAP
jgi:hypothetical protein